jgi:hypothetical protein
MNPLENTNVGSAIAVRKTIVPAQAPPSQQMMQEKATYSWLTKLICLVKRYTAADYGRLKEAGISMVENESKKKGGEAAKLFAEAEEIHARAELLRQEKAIKDAAISASWVNNNIDTINATAAALERLSNAISNIKQKGGDVGFDQEQLEKAVGIGLLKYPDASVRNENSEE